MASKATAKSGGIVETIVERLKDSRRPVVLLLNKVDRIKREKLLALTQDLSSRVAFERVFMISALTGSGCDDLMNWLADRLPEGPWYYPEDQISDLPLRQLAAEITREKLFLRLHQEIPYASTVETELWEQRPDGSVRIEQTIYVERDSQKAIVLGRKGETIKAIGQAARTEIAEAAALSDDTERVAALLALIDVAGDDPLIAAVVAEEKRLPRP